MQALNDAGRLATYVFGDMVSAA